MLTRRMFLMSGSGVLLAQPSNRIALGVIGAYGPLALLGHSGDVLSLTDGERHLQRLGVSLTTGDLAAFVRTPLPEAARDVALLDRMVAIDVLRARSDADAKVLVTQLGADATLPKGLRERASAHGVGERVRFIGNLSQNEVAAWLAAADVIAVPSVRDDSGNVDGLPNIVLEALASGTPLIATPAGGIGSVVEHEHTGLLVAERDADALANAIMTLASNPERRVRLGNAGRAAVVARFGWEFAAGRFEAAYDRALAIASGRR